MHMGHKSAHNKHQKKRERLCRTPTLFFVFLNQANPNFHENVQDVISKDIF